jgi:hypothetical protein
MLAKREKEKGNGRRMQILSPGNRYRLQTQIDRTNKLFPVCFALSLIFLVALGVKKGIAQGLIQL